MDILVLRLLFNAFGAIIVLILYVVDVMLVIDPGNWMRFLKVVVIAGAVILVSLFLKEQWRFVGMAASFLLSLSAIIFSHAKMLLSKERREKKKKAELVKKFLQ